jgi:SAM-dependent methyltransferase
MGMDVNDWIEQELGWDPALPILEKTTFPFLRDDSVVCELGPGTGRFSLHILKMLPKGALLLVDHSAWIVRFLQDYFQANPRVRVYRSDGNSLPFEATEYVDVIFSSGVFIELSLGFFYEYSRAFWEALKPGGHCILDYIDITTREGWEFLLSNSGTNLAKCFTYHTREALDRIFRSVGFEVLKRCQVDKSTYVVFRKPERLKRVASSR